MLRSSTDFPSRWNCVSLSPEIELTLRRDASNCVAAPIAARIPVTTRVAATTPIEVSALCARIDDASVLSAPCSALLAKSSRLWAATRICETKLVLFAVNTTLIVRNIYAGAFAVMSHACDKREPARIENTRPLPRLLDEVEQVLRPEPDDVVIRGESDGLEPATRHQPVEHGERAPQRSGGFLPVNEQRQRQGAHRRTAVSGSAVLLAVLQVASQFGWIDEVCVSHSGARQAFGRDEPTNVPLSASQPVRDSGSREPPMHV